MNAHGDGVFDLRTDFALGLVGFDVLESGAGFGPEIAVGIEQARNFVFGFDRTPAVCLPFGGEGEVQAEIGVGLRLGIRGDLGQPGAGNHDAGGRGRLLVEGVETGRVFRVGDREVVGMDDKKLGIARVA
jgi:hypothetical protein